MNAIEAAIQLGAALAESKEVIALQQSKNDLMSNDAAMEALFKVEQLKRDYEKLKQAENADAQNMKGLSEEIERMEKFIREDAILTAYVQAQQDYAGLMGRINAIIQHYVTGETEDEGGCGGCKGSCSGCQGCH
ncbi:MAG: YlbF family regulator [Christensenellales bacterium]|jgi:cell fate (sporulation/competence/biofilm development) regulator YlbF (YheA/YmcA/DUF963 family)